MYGPEGSCFEFNGFEVAKRFLDSYLSHKSVDLKRPTRCGTLLHCLVKCSYNLEAVQHFLALKPEPQVLNFQDGNGWKAIHHAIACKCNDIVEYFIKEKGMNVNDMSAKKYLLQIAIANQNEDAIPCLVKEFTKQLNSTECRELKKLLLTSFYDYQLAELAIKLINN